MCRPALVAIVGLSCVGGTSAAATTPFACGGFALLGGAQLLCSHVDSHAPTQMCTFSWALTTTDGTPTVQQGTFVLPPGSANAQVYQGSGFSGELSGPIVLCQAKRSR